MSRRDEEASRLVKILDILLEESGPPKPGLDFADPWQCLIATMLSAQCTDVQVNKHTPGLFARFSTPARMAEADVTEVEELILSLGLHRNKAKNLVSMGKLIVEKHGGRVVGEREALEALPGIGRKTASVVLAHAFDQPAFAVDTHVGRICHRWGFAPKNDPLVVEKAITALLEPERWIEAHLTIIRHGRTICKARKPVCGECPVVDLCPWPNKGI